MTNANQLLIVVKGLIFYEGQVLLVKRSSQEEVGGGTWELVGGKMVFGETLETSLRREIKEETGLDVVIEKLLYATTFQTDPTRQIVLLSYLCQSETDNVTLSDEHSEYRWTSKKEARLLLTPEIIRDFENHAVFTLAKFE